MLGYVTIEKGELKVREYEVYNGFYCGICKSIGKRIGQIPRMILSYDAVFLAVLIDSVSEEPNRLEMQHCVAHHIEKKPVILDCNAIDYAADVMVILAYKKALDDWDDDRNASAFAIKSALVKSYGKVKKLHPQVCDKIDDGLLRLSALEKNNSGNLDLTGEAFADIMAGLFTGFNPADENVERIFSSIGKYLGYWIYLIDAADDLADDIEKGNYNPLKYRFPDDSPEEIYERIKPLLYTYLAQLGNAVDLLGMKKNKGIVENIVFMGLRRRTEMVLKKGTTEND